MVGKLVLVHCKVDFDDSELQVARVSFRAPRSRQNHELARLPESVHFKGAFSVDFDDSGPPAAPGSFRHPRTASEGLSPI